MPGQFLETMTWPEAEAALLATPVVLLPLGARLKEHGPHLPLNNDWLMAEHLAKRVAERSEVLVAPTIQYHYYPALAGYPGSTHVRRQPATEIVIDLVHSFTRHGAQRCYVLNTGISTCWALEPARQRLLADGHVMDYTDLSEAVREVEEEVSEQERGTHADELETSMMLYLAPEVVRLERAVRDDNPRRGRGPLTRDPEATTGIYSPTGTWGDPTLATREKGERIVEALLDHVAAALEALREEDYAPPPPRDRYLG